MRDQRGRGRAESTPVPGVVIPDDRDDISPAWRPAGVHPPLHRAAIWTPWTQTQGRRTNVLSCSALRLTRQPTTPRPPLIAADRHPAQPRPMAHRPLVSGARGVAPFPPTQADRRSGGFFASRRSARRTPDRTAGGGSTSAVIGGKPLDRRAIRLRRTGARGAIVVDEPPHQRLPPYLASWLLIAAPVNAGRL